MYASRKKVFNLNFSTWRVAFADVLVVVRLLRRLCPLTLTYICRNVGCVSVEQEKTTHMQIDYTHTHTQRGHAQLTLTLFLRIIMWFPSGIRTCVCPVSMCVSVSVCVLEPRPPPRLISEQTLRWSTGETSVSNGYIFFVCVNNYLQHLGEQRVGTWALATLSDWGGEKAVSLSS